MICKGTVHKYGDNIDTDVIIPARLLNNPDQDFLGRHCMEDIDKDFVQRVQPGDILVGGENFGCGSSREHAPIAIRASGISIVIAESFARIFFRNAINIGLSLLECPEAAKEAAMGDTLEVDLDRGVVHNVSKGTSHAVPPFPPFIQEIINAGGLVGQIQQKMQGDGNA